MKTSHARIIIYINSVEFRLANATDIAQKLEMDYVGTIRNLAAMTYKKWLTKIRVKGQYKVFYKIEDEEQIEEAKQLLANGG